MTHASPESAGSQRPAVVIIVLLTFGYLIAAALGWPQAATRLILAGDHHAEQQSPAENHAAPAEAPHTEPGPDVEAGASDEHASAAEPSAAIPSPIGYASLR